MNKKEFQNNAPRLQYTVTGAAAVELKPLGTISQIPWLLYKQFTVEHISLSMTNTENIIMIFRKKSAIPNFPSKMPRNYPNS